MRQYKLNERQRFSIRKFSLGVVSILLGSVFVIISQISQVQATEVDAVLSPTDTLNKKELKNLINEIDGKLTRGVYATKTEESVNSLKRTLEEANATLTKATTQDELTKAYRVLLTATTRLQSKPKTPKPKLEPEEESLLNKVVMVDTTNGKPTVGKKAENTEPKAGTNSIENTGSHDSRNGKVMDTDNPFRTGEQPASEPIADESYNSFVFSENDTDFKNHSKLEWFSKEGDNSRNNASLKYGEDEDGKYMEWKSSQSRGGGFKLTIDKELGEEYTIGVKFSFDQTNGSWRKIIDYKNSKSDNGFYFYNGGHLQFYPNGTISKNSVSNKEVVNFIIVKSKEEFAVYFVKKDGNITKEFSLTDSTTLSNSIPYTNNGKTILGFFFDDERTGSEATSGGKIYSLSIYDKAIEPSKVLEKLNKKLDSDTHQPELKSPLPDVEKGSTPNAEDFIKNLPNSNETNKLPENTRITWKTDGAPDTSTVGLKPAKILVTYPDKSVDEIDVNVNVIAVTRPDAPKVTANEETATVSIQPIGDVDKVKVIYTPTGGTTEKTIEIVKENGVWKDKSNTPGVSVDSTNGVITLDHTVAKDGTEVKAVSTKGNSAESDVGKAKDPVKQAKPAAPKVTANEETATVSIQPIGDVDKVKVIYTPTGGTTEKTIEIVKENGVWKDKSNTPGVSVDSTNGVITLDHTVAEDGTAVKAVATKGNSDESAPGTANDPVKQAKPAAPTGTAIDPVKQATSAAPEISIPNHGDALEEDTTQPASELPIEDESERVTSNEETAKIDKNVPKQKESQNILPNTGTAKGMGIFSAAAVSILTGLGLIVPVKKENEDIQNL